MSSEKQIRGYFGFESSDLITNRMGRFSEKQREKYDDLDTSTSKFLLIAAILFLAGAIWRATILLSASEEWSAWILPVILLAISVWLFSGAFTKVDAAVEKTEGVVNFIKVERKTGSVTDAEIDRTVVHSYEMRVGGVAFSNANPALIEYMQGNIYAVYYTNSTHQVLSAEFIAKGK